VKKILGSLFVGALIGIGIVMAMDYFGVDMEAITGFQLFIVVVALVFFFLLGIVVHEFGHLLGGLLSGYRFSLFRLGSWAWYREDGKIVVTRSKNFAIGQCVMLPTGDFADFKFVLYNLGGVLAQFLLSGILLLIPASGTWRASLLVGAGANILIALLNLIPLKNQEAPNDGANVWEAFKSTDAKYGLYMMFYVHGKMMEGQTLKDLSPDMFKLKGDTRNYFVAYLHILKASYLEELGQYEEALAIYEGLDLAHLPAFYRDNLLLELLYYASFHVLDVERAMNLYEDKRLKWKLKLRIPHVLRIQAAYEAFVLKQPSKVHANLKLSRTLAEALPIKGERILELAQLDLIASKLQEGVGSFRK